jgi:hypothetical protein
MKSSYPEKYKEAIIIDYKDDHKDVVQALTGRH